VKDAKRKILVVEDDEEIAGFLRRGLTHEGYAVDVATDGISGLRSARRNDHAVVILDRFLPGMEGGEVCRRLRAEGLQTLVLMLTAMDGLEDKIDGLRLGADDYLTKPFSFDELLARLQALLRRAPGVAAPAAELRVGALRLDRTRKQAYRGDRELALTATELALLECLMEHAGAVVGRPQILAVVWGYVHDPQTNIVDVYIRYLRRKVDRPGEVPLITTIRGFGYLLRSDGDA
jgi:two-component system, OmpR family, response regulator